MQNSHRISWKIATKALNMPSQDIWKFTPMSYRTSALWGRCPAPTPLLQLELITPSRASGTADHVRSLDDLLCMFVEKDVWMGVGRPCPIVHNDIVTPRHLFYVFFPSASSLFSRLYLCARFMAFFALVFLESFWLLFCFVMTYSFCYRKWRLYGFIDPRFRMVSTSFAPHWEPLKRKWWKGEDVWKRGRIMR